jgi:hypothetical protein
LEDLHEIMSISVGRRKALALSEPVMYWQICSVRKRRVIFRIKTEDGNIFWTVFFSACSRMFLIPRSPQRRRWLQGDTQRNSLVGYLCESKRITFVLNLLKHEFLVHSI